MRSFAFSYKLSKSSNFLLTIDFIQDEEIVFSVTTMRKLLPNPYHKFDEKREYQRCQNKIQGFINDFINYGLENILKMRYLIQCFVYDNSIIQVTSTFYLTNVHLNCRYNYENGEIKNYIIIPYDQKKYEIIISTDKPFILGDSRFPAIYQEINNKTSTQVLSEYKGCTYTTSQIQGLKYIFKEETPIYFSKEAYTKINTVDYLLERKVLSGNPIIDIDEAKHAMLLVFKHGEKIIITDVDNGKAILE